MGWIPGWGSLWMVLPSISVLNLVPLSMGILFTHLRRNEVSILWSSLSGYASAWQTQKWILTVSYGMEHRAPSGGARESSQGAEGGTTI
jgi:hypothetical protein